MKLLFILALASLPASLAFGDDAQKAPITSVVSDKPAPELLALEAELSRKQQEQQGQNASSPEQYKEFVAGFRARLGKTMKSIEANPANKSVHARILVRLGDSGQALKNLEASLAHDPKNPELLTAKGFILFDKNDYAGSAAAARAALEIDPKSQGALWLKHASEDRKAPSLKLPGSPWETGVAAGPVGGAIAQETDKPYTLEVKIGAAAPPPAPTPSTDSKTPSGKTDPLVPLALAGVGLWIAAGVASKQFQDRTVEGVEHAGEAAADGASTAVQWAKKCVEEHPYGTTAVVGGALILGTVLAGPFVGGPTLMAAGAYGESVPVASAAGSASAALRTAAAASAGTLILSVGGDAPQYNNKHKNSGKKVSEILSERKGSIRQAPLEPGSPSWDEFSRMTWEEIEAGAKADRSGFRTVKKLLTDGRFAK